MVVAVMAEAIPVDARERRDLAEAANGGCLILRPLSASCVPNPPGRSRPTSAAGPTVGYAPIMVIASDGASNSLLPFS